ncbi:hypothetical protein GG892_24685 [Salmonella enterica]|nr:hypothetical protein [Salmonella enterica]EJN5974456.1 hypothetical protein [Salmonella enterica]
MMNNKLTDERIAELFECVDMCDDMSIDENADMASALRELQQRRLADKNCFMYGIAEPDGSAYLDEVCVSRDVSLLQSIADELNISDGTDGYRVVALYTALPLTDSERIELQERRKADSAEPVYQWREAFEEGSLWDDCTKAQYDGFAKKTDCEVRILYTTPPAPVVPDDQADAFIAAIEKEQDRLHEEDYLMDSKDCIDVIREEVQRLNACRAAMLQSKYRDLSQPVDPQVAEYEQIMLQGGAK